MKDYYELLEVNKKASPETIKKVFRMMVKKNHPDLFEGDEKLKAEERVKELNEAYEILINEDSRKEYDLELEESMTDERIQTLIEENDYLKSVIASKDHQIKEFLASTGAYDFADTYDDGDAQDTTSESTDEKDYYEDYSLKDRIWRIIYIVLFVIGGCLILWATIGINMFEILRNAFKNMF